MERRITNEQREAIVRNAVAARDAALAAPSDAVKLWLWKNFVDGRPEYWAFDNPYPIHLDNGDPQTLGEPCGYALLKPSRQGRTDVSEERVLQAIARAQRPAQSHGHGVPTGSALTSEAAKPLASSEPDVPASAALAASLPALLLQAVEALEDAIVHLPRRTANECASVAAALRQRIGGE